MAANTAIGTITNTPLAGPTPRRPRSPPGSTYQIVAGLRTVKGYPVTRDELYGLGGAGFIATVCFSLGGNYLNRSYDIRKDLELTPGVSAEMKMRWETKASDDLFFGVIIMIIGVVAILAGGAKILSIIKATDHPNG